MFGLGEAVVIGYDLSNEYAQISYMSKSDDMARTLSLTKDSEDYNIPACLFKRGEVNQWCTSFYCWLFVKSFGVEQARKMLYLPVNSLAAGCTYAVDYYRKTGHAHHPDAAAAGTAKQYQRGQRSAVVVSRRGNAVVAIRAGHHPDDGGHGAACPRADHHGQSHAHRDMAQPTHDLRRTDSHYRHVCHPFIF